MPLKKMKRIAIEVAKKVRHNTGNEKELFLGETMMYISQAISGIKAIIKRIPEYLRKSCNCFQYYLIKSFIAVYIAAPTPRRERIIVKTGVSRRNSLSSFVPAHTVIRIIATI